MKINKIQPQQLIFQSVKVDMKKVKKNTGPVLYEYFETLSPECWLSKTGETNNISVTAYNKNLATVWIGRRSGAGFFRYAIDFNPNNYKTKQELEEDLIKKYNVLQKNLLKIGIKI